MTQGTIALLIATIGGIYDWRLRRIPNWLTLGSFFLVLLFNIFHLRSEAIINCLLGFLVGILLLFIPYVVGGMGAGDVKLLGAIGSLIGFKDVILVFFYSTTCGLILGLIWLAITPGRLKFLITTGQVLPTVDKKQKVPYGIAICLGTILYIALGKSSFLNLNLWQ